MRTARAGVRTVKAQRPDAAFALPYGRASLSEAESGRSALKRSAKAMLASTGQSLAASSSTETTEAVTGSGPSLGAAACAGLAAGGAPEGVVARSEGQPRRARAPDTGSWHC